MEKEKLKSGNYLYFDLAEITESLQLFQIIVQEFKLHGIKLKIDMETDICLKDIFLKNTDSCINGLADVVSSQKVMDCIFNCAKKCLYERNGIKQKISLETFNSMEARQDLFEIMFKIAKRNLKPFFLQAPTE